MAKHRVVGKAKKRQSVGLRRTEEVLPDVDKLREPALPRVFEVVVVCRHEEEQRAVYERMCGEGFRCRVMVL
jgi:hypothetical protein